MFVGVESLRTDFSRSEASTRSPSPEDCVEQWGKGMGFQWVPPCSTRVDLKCITIDDWKNNAFCDLMRYTLPSRKWNDVTIINKPSNAFLIGFQTSTRDLLRNQLQFEWASSDACNYFIQYFSGSMRHEVNGNHGRHCVTARLTAPRCFFAAGLASMNQWHQLQHVYRRRPRNWLWHLISDIWSFWSPLAKEDNFSVGGGSGRACPQRSTKWVQSSITL